MAWIAGVVGAALNIAGGIGANIDADKTRKQLLKTAQTDPKYTQSPYAAQRLALANQLINARMPGAASAERNIAAGQANSLANINRNATDASQALALAAASQGQADTANNNLAQQEAQDYYTRLNFLNGAQQGMITEGDKSYQDDVRRFDNRIGVIQSRGAIRQSQWQNVSSMGDSVSSLGSVFGGGGAAGGAKK